MNLLQCPDVMEDIRLVLNYDILDPPAPVPPVQNEIVGLFRSCESSTLPGALASAIERAEEAHRGNLERLTAIRGTRVRINLHLQNIPRIFVRLAAVTERLLALSEAHPALSGCYQGLDGQDKATTASPNRGAFHSGQNGTPIRASHSDPIVYQPLPT